MEILWQNLPRSQRLIAILGGGFKVFVFFDFSPRFLGQMIQFDFGAYFFKCFFFFFSQPPIFMDLITSRFFKGHQFLRVQEFGDPRYYLVRQGKLEAGYSESCAGPLNQEITFRKRPTDTPIRMAIFDNKSILRSHTHRYTVTDMLQIFFGFCTYFQNIPRIAIIICSILP